MASDCMSTLRKEVAEITKRTKISYYIDDDADYEQANAILGLAKTGESFMMLNVPLWIQKHYLVKPSPLTIQAKYVDGKLAFHKHWPLGNYIYAANYAEDVDMAKATKVRYNSKRVQEYEETLGCEYYMPEFTGMYIAEVPGFVVYGVKLPGGKKYVR